MNKGIYLKTADIYLRFPEIMEEECNDLAEFLEDEHIVYEGATDIVYNLQQENQELKKQYCERTDCSGRLGNSKKVDQLEKELEQLKEIEKEHQRINGSLHLEIKELQEQLSINTLQLEEMKLSKRDYTQENILTMKLTLKETQQKEFIEYLENEIKELKDRIDKAIEYATKEMRIVNDNEYHKLVEILKGDKE